MYSQILCGFLVCTEVIHVGDILHVTGFNNVAPQFRFVRHRNVLLGIDSTVPSHRVRYVTLER
jgi:hypothetical protein